MTDQKAGSGHSWTIIGLVLAAVGIVSPIIWEWWSNRTGLALTRVQNVAIVERNVGVKGLEIRYAGRPIECLSKSVFRLQNVGRIPIEQGDVVEPVRLAWKEGRILDAAIESREPANTVAEVSVKEGCAVLSAPLLNPDDAIVFSVLTESASAVFDAGARIKNIKQLDVEDVATPVEPPRRTNWVLIVVGLFVVVALGGAVVCLVEIPAQRRVLAALSAVDSPIRPGVAVADVQAFAAEQLDYLSGEREVAVKEALARFGDHLTADQAAELTRTIRTATKTEPSLQGGLFGVAVSVIGVIYILYEIF